jgi:hypothetical protein
MKMRMRFVILGVLALAALIVKVHASPKDMMVKEVTVTGDFSCTSCRLAHPGDAMRRRLLQDLHRGRRSSPADGGRRADVHPPQRRDAGKDDDA